jgi:S-adenosylmethionine:tRNA-ribosyltransferase-isomerase (queuine synthetase)
MNHLAHSEASKAAKTTDANLRHKIEDLELNNTKYEAELKRCALFVYSGYRAELTDMLVVLFYDL